MEKYPWINTSLSVETSFTVYMLHILGKFSFTYISSLFFLFQRSVVNSKQFPFRFFSAFEVLEKLKEEFETSRK